MRISKLALIMISVLLGASGHAASVPPGVAKDYLNQHVIGKAFCAMSEGRVVGLHFSKSWIVSVIDGYAGTPSPYTYFKLVPGHDGISGDLIEYRVLDDQALRKIGMLTYRENAVGSEGAVWLGALTGDALGLPDVPYLASQCPK